MSLLLLFSPGVAVAPPATGVVVISNPAQYGRAETKTFTKGMAVAAGTFTFPASYTTGGIAFAVTPGVAQSANATLVVNFHPTGGYAFEYVKATGKVKAYTTAATEVASLTNLSGLGPIPYVVFTIPGQ